MARIVEKPALKLRDRLFPSRSGGLLVDPLAARSVEPEGSGRAK